jgi:hypothetical protein
MHSDRNLDCECPCHLNIAWVECAMCCGQSATWAKTLRLQKKLWRYERALAEIREFHCDGHHYGVPTVSPCPPCIAEKALKGESVHARSER